jgi:ribonuclease HII
MFLLESCVNIIDMRIIGIDEAGRGPVAGPLSVAAVSLEKELSLEEEPLSFLKGDPFKDSKKISPKRRNAIFEFIKGSKDLEFVHLFIKADFIDKNGISMALKCAVEELLEKLGAGFADAILLDGNLYAPDKYTKQETIIKGDEKILEITLASVVAKVMRDKYMEDLAGSFPEYGFEKHKGYGTKQHMELIRKFGLCQEHRNTFLRNLKI